MKTIVLSIFMLLTVPLFSQNITVLQINADWNSTHTRNDLSKLKGCTYKFGWLDEQPSSVRDNVSSVPTVVIFKDGRPVKVYRAGLSLKLETPFEEIQKEIYRLRE